MSSENDDEVEEVVSMEEGDGWMGWMMGIQSRSKNKKWSGGTSVKQNSVKRCIGDSGVNGMHGKTGN